MISALFRFIFGLSIIAGFIYSCYCITVLVVVYNFPWGR